MAETQAAQNRRRSERVKLNMAVHVLAENEERQWTVDYGRIDQTEDFAPMQNLTKNDEEQVASDG